jgi:hypothetical protein
VIVLIVFKNRSASSDGFPEKYGKLSYLALRARATSVESAICCEIVEIPVNNDLLGDRDCDVN